MSSLCDSLNSGKTTPRFWRWFTRSQDERSKPARLGAQIAVDWNRVLACLRPGNPVGVEECDGQLVKRHLRCSLIPC